MESNIQDLLLDKAKTSYRKEIKADRVLKEKKECLKEMKSHETDKFGRKKKTNGNNRRKNYQILTT